MPGYFFDTSANISPTSGRSSRSATLEQAGAQAVVDVVVVVGDVVAQRRDLRLRPGMAVELEIVVLAVFDDGGRQVAPACGRP